MSAVIGRSGKIKGSGHFSRLVYFIEVVDLDRVKIGSSDNVRARMTQIQTCTPFDLRLIGVVPGGHAREQDLHAFFAEHRVRGEWFVLSKIRSQVEKLLQQDGVPMPESGFIFWLKKQRRRKDAVGELAAEVIQDYDVRAETLEEFRDHILYRNGSFENCRHSIEAAKVAWGEYIGVPYVPPCSYCDRNPCRCAELGLHRISLEEVVKVLSGEIDIQSLPKGPGPQTAQTPSAPPTPSSGVQVRYRLKK